MNKFSFITVSLFFVTLPLCAQSKPIVPGLERKKDPIPRELDIMYSKGLKYLSSSQSENGTWSSDGGYGSYPGTVALGLLAFLAYGEDPNNGPYASNIKKSLNYLLDIQNKNGYLGSTSKNNVNGGNMYSHGFATLALAEAYGMIDDPRIGKALRDAVELSTTAQKTNTRKAWRYSPTSKDADSTLTGCIIVSLYAARNAGIHVSNESLSNALKYMDSCRSKSSGGYGYTSPSGARVTLTAIGSLCFSLAKQKSSESYKKTLDNLKKHINHRETNYPFYYEYYMSQALFHADSTLWEEWNKKNIKYMRTLQTTDGSFADPSNRKGKAFSTSAGLLSLALNYRFLPIYEK